MEPVRVLLFTIDTTIIAFYLHNYKTKFSPGFRGTREKHKTCQNKPSLLGISKSSPVRQNFAGEDKRKCFKVKNK